MASGPNILTIHATNLAGNPTTTNFVFSLDYSGDTTPPALNLVWPLDGASIAGNSFTLQAHVDDPEATVVVSVLDPGGNTTTVSGSVQRNGNVWVSNVPLAAGNNTVSVTATDAAGNATTTSIAVSQSS